MNILVDKFPTKINLKGRIFKINSDFRVGIKIIQMYEDETLAQEEKTFIMLKLLYKEKIPQELIEEAINKAIIFLNADENINNKNETSDIPVKRLYSFTKDAKYIYSAIKKTHNVDLERIGYLHWWKFVYYFLDLDEKCFFSQMIYLRNQKNKGKLTKEEKSIYSNLEDILELDSSLEYSEEEQEAINKFMNYLGEE